MLTTKHPKSTFTYQNFDIEYHGFGVLNVKKIYYINLKIHNTKNHHIVFKSILIDSNAQFIKELKGSINSKSSYNGLFRIYNGDENSFVNKKGNIIKINFPYKIDENITTQTKFKNIKKYKENLTTICLKDKWGFIDKKRNLIIDAKYDNAYDFKEGLARVELNGKWGFIDKKGEIAIDTKYNKTKDFFQGMAAVEIDNKWGFIDKKGNLVIKAKYDFIDGLDDDLAFFDIQGASKIGLYLILNKENIVSYFHDGLASILINKKFGFIDKNEKLIIKAQYDEVGHFNKDFAKVKQSDKWGLIDKKGKIIVKIKYDQIIILDNNLILAIKDKIVNMINLKIKKTIKINVLKYINFDC
ncbi:WG repeat-containing protein [Campylobacter lari]|uniref:WG repeat-containing protein n=1 Tax=Campylobacter lari TaxID=201 RepID=A0A7M1MFW5_CAMLA|nr:WG repeat-containing protein [Campylobacter lari]HEC1767638.1 WG repeat-containing protein [Campylobacter lari]